MCLVWVATLTQRTYLYESLLHVLQTDSSVKVLHIQRLILKGRGLEKRPYDVMYRLSYSPILHGYDDLQQPQKHSHMWSK